MIDTWVYVDYKSMIFRVDTRTGVVQRFMVNRKPDSQWLDIPHNGIDYKRVIGLAMKKLVAGESHGPPKIIRRANEV